MTRAEIEAAYSVNENGTIISPDKFEGEPIYVPYFWDAFLNGGADEDNGEMLFFNVTLDDRAEFPELEGIETVELCESEQGFVCSAAYGGTRV